MIKKTVYIIGVILNLISVDLVAEETNNSPVYNKKNVSIPKMFLNQTDKKRYEIGGDRNLPVYEQGDSINGVPLAKESITDITDDNVIPCHSGEINLSTKITKIVNGKSITIRKMHDIYGIPENGKSTGSSSATSGYDGNIALDSTGLPSYGEIINNLISGKEENSNTGRYCTAKSLNNTNIYDKKSDEGQYDTPREYCKAGDLSEIFYSSFQDPYGKKPSCRLTLDTDIRIDEVRFLRQAIAPDNLSNDYDNYSIGNGIVKCSLLNGNPTLVMLENPPESTSCTPATYASSPCCNPLTGFGCEAQFCQYGANKHCKGQEIPNQGSCSFKSNITVAVKDIIKLTDNESGGVGEFKCLENGLWQPISITGC